MQDFYKIVRDQSTLHMQNFIIAEWNIRSRHSSLIFTGIVQHHYNEQQMHVHFLKWGKL